MASLLVSDSGAEVRRVSVGSARCRERGAESIALGAACRVARGLAHSVAADSGVDARTFAHTPRFAAAIGSDWLVASSENDTRFHCKNAPRSEEGNDGGAQLILAVVVCVDRLTRCAQQTPFVEDNRRVSW